MLIGYQDLLLKEKAAYAAQQADFKGIYSLPPWKTTNPVASSKDNDNPITKIIWGKKNGGGSQFWKWR